MKIKPLKEALSLCRDAVITPFIWGHRGLGKSQITSQYATEQHMGFADWRLSQNEASDLRGLPMADKETMITRFLPPSDLPVGGMSWEEYMSQMRLLPVLEETIKDEKQVGALLDADPSLPENPPEVIRILQLLGHFTAADGVARMRQMLQPKLTRGIMFLDELNRAQDDVLQAVFQLVLDHQLGSYVLPSGWQIVTAGNYMEGYMTNGFTDAAFLDRFTHLVLDGGDLTLDEWVDYMSSRHRGAAAQVIEFATQNIKHLDGDIKGELGFSVQPSRRSWEAVVRVEAACAKTSYGEDARMGVIAGLVGRETAMAYVRYNCPVRPKDLIAMGVEHFKPKLKTLSRNQRTGLCWGLVSFLKGHVDDDKNAKVAMDFAKFLAKEGTDKDIAVAFCNMMIGGTNLKARAALVSNPAVAKLIGRFRGANVKKVFADRLNEDPELQKLMAKCAWGASDDEK